MTDAPYTDPDGYPSWQPNPAVREMDAWSRRYRKATDWMDRAEQTLRNAQQIVTYMQAEYQRAGIAVSHLLDEHNNMDRRDDNPNRPYRPEV